MNSIIKEHRWTIVEQPADVVSRLAEEINVPKEISTILVNRGITTYDAAKAYFRPTVQLLNDPFLMTGMEEATARLITAIQSREKILVFGDYDVDGTNGAAMLYLFIKDLGGAVDFYIPDRIIEGYGISNLGVEKAHAEGYSVFLSVDCGITAVAQAELARSKGIDMIICDHHEPGSTLPNALATLDPLRPGDVYPFKSLCGCGVGFKLIQGIARKLGMESTLASYMDFVALASTADIVPLIDENRVLVRAGMDLINSNPRPGIRALIESSGLEIGKITTGQVVFMLAPRINAVGRLGDAMRAVRLLTSTNPEEAHQLAQVLEEENLNRRRIDEETFAEAQELAESVLNVDTDAALVLHQEHWHPGVVGIVASRMVEKYYKPSIMMATVDGVAKGSARSVSGFDIFQALKRCEDKIIQFGGHKYAAGLTVEIEKVDEFRQAFNDVVNELMTEEMKTREIHIDVEISLTDMTPKFIRILKEFAPFGPSNMKPTFLGRNLEVFGNPRIVGKNHLRFRVRQNGVVFDAIGFGLGDLMPKVNAGRKDLECVFSIDEHESPAPSGGRKGDVVPQLKVRDIR
ncbi:MAG TPA: single-stranded-DNA-specific exonuclease RecJ [Bacteroidota bacterium]